MKKRLGIVALACAAWAQQPMIEQVTDLLTVYAPSNERGSGWRKSRIAGASQWRDKRADIARRVSDIMGAGPAATAGIVARTLSEERAGGYTRRKVTYTGADGRPIPAWLLIPAGGRGPFPAAVAAHPTHATGKNSVVGLDPESQTPYGAELAGRGFVVLAPDMITAGERVLPGAQPYVTAPFDREHPGWSAMGKMLADHRRGLDYLETLHFVDRKRLCAIGHSLGGYNSFFLAAFDERVKAAVVSCGFTTLGRASRPFAWARPEWFVHVPRLAPYLRAGIAPFDFHEVMAMAAPRAVFNYSARGDSIFPDAAEIEAALGQVSGVYRLLEAPDNFKVLMGEGPHAFPPDVRRAAYEWLEKHL